jgi:hypothetical protein
MVDRMDQIPVMGDKDQSPASFAARAREKRGDLTCVLIVEVADRLVGEDERGIVDESPGNRDLTWPTITPPFLGGSTDLWI